MKKGQIVAVAVAFAIAATAAHAQKGLDVALSGAGVFTSTTRSSSSNVSDSPTKSVAVFGTVRYHFKSRHAVELTLGHTRNSQIFDVPPDTYRVLTGVLEYSGAYVFTPFASEKWQPFFLGGVGGLAFSAGNTYMDGIQQSLGTSSQLRPAVLYGLGTDYNFWRHLGLRVQYRGLIYRNPDFGAPSRFYTGARSHLAEPSVGIVVRF